MKLYCEKLFARLVHRKKTVKSSTHFKCLSNGPHWIAFAVAVLWGQQKGDKGLNNTIYCLILSRFRELASFPKVPNT